MKTEADLERIFDELWHNRPILKREALAPSLKLLRSIQIDALRRAREIVEGAVRYYQPTVPETPELDDAVRSASLSALDKLIRELDLK